MVHLCISLHKLQIQSFKYVISNTLLEKKLKRMLSNKTNAILCEKIHTQAEQIIIQDFFSNQLWLDLKPYDDN